MGKNHRAKLEIFNMFLLIFILSAFVIINYLDFGVLRLALAITLTVSGMIGVIVNFLQLVVEHKAPQ